MKYDLKLKNKYRSFVSQKLNQVQIVIKSKQLTQPTDEKSI